jgi:hypothetical protein
MEKLTIEEAKKFFTDFYGGEHKLPSELTKFGTGYQVQDGRTDFDTYDGNRLTRLVIMAHDRCFRVSLMPLGHMMQVVIWKRQREGSIDMRHPTIEEAVSGFRNGSPSAACR